MMRGLIKNKKMVAKNKVDMNLVAIEYRNWMDSPPFDIGTTTIGGLKPL